MGVRVQVFVIYSIIICEDGRTLVFCYLFCFVVVYMVTVGYFLFDVNLQEGLLDYSNFNNCVCVLSLRVLVSPSCLGILIKSSTTMYISYRVV